LEDISFGVFDYVEEEDYFTALSAALFISGTAHDSS